MPELPLLGAIGYDWLAMLASRSFYLGLAALLLVSLAAAGCAPGDWSKDRLETSSVKTVAAPGPSATPQASATWTPTAHPSPTLAPTGTSTLSPAPVTATATATPLPCWEEGGRYEQGSLRTFNLPLPMEYSVYLPPCYDQQPERRYPVLYLIHGMNYNHDQWDRLGADEAADALIAAGEVPPFIIVLPRDRSWAQPDEDLFGQVLVDELLPYIDQHYRTLPGRTQRAVGGLSRGAGWAVHLGLSRWDLFGAIGGHSLPVFWSDTGKIRSWLAEIPPESLPRIYLDIGEKDRQTIMESVKWFENLLTELSIPHEWYLNPGYHEEAYWTAHVEEYLRWYAQGWTTSP